MGERALGTAGIGGGGVTDGRAALPGSEKPIALITVCGERNIPVDGFTPSNQMNDRCQKRTIPVDSGEKNVGGNPYSSCRSELGEKEESGGSGISLY